MTPKELSDHFSATYKALRLGLAIIAFVFPPWLVIGGKLFADLDWQGSMSAYYHASPRSQKDAAEQQSAKPEQAAKASTTPTPAGPTHPGEGTMRNWFVGLLFAVGIILYLYKGFTVRENIALNISGAMGLGVALFPMGWGPEFPGHEVKLLGLTFSLHGFCALTLFLGIAYVCIRRAKDTLHLISDPDRRNRYRSIYRTQGHLMWVFPVIAWLLSSFQPGRPHLIFLAEMLGIWIFGAYWFTKSREISETSADELALKAQLTVPYP